MLTSLVRRGSVRREDGQLTILVLGYTAIAALLILVAIDASAMFLARRALSAAADDAAVAAASGVNTGSIYRNGISCGRPLPLDADRAAALARGSVAGDTQLTRLFGTIHAPATTVHGRTVEVRLTAQATLPFGPFIGLLDHSLAKGRATIHVSSQARSPVVIAGSCG